MVWTRSTWQEQATIRNRLSAMIKAPPRLEPSWYGPLDKYMNGHIGEDAMLKPQAPLRESNEAPAQGPTQEQDPDVSIDSVDSYGHTTTGPEGRKAYPDFAICLYTASATGDVLKAIIEVKHPGRMGRACSDLVKYLNLHGDEDMIGIAIAGNNVDVISLDSTQPGGYRVIRRMSLLHRSFTNFVFDLSTVEA